MTDLVRYPSHPLGIMPRWAAPSESSIRVILVIMEAGNLAQVGRPVRVEYDSDGDDWLGVIIRVSDPSQSSESVIRAMLSGAWPPGTRIGPAASG